MYSRAPIAMLELYPARTLIVQLWYGGQRHVVLVGIVLHYLCVLLCLLQARGHRLWDDQFCAVHDGTIDSV
jgi:hypothetical protein